MPRSFFMSTKLTVVVFLTSLTVSTAASAFSQEQAIQAKIPFSFIVGEKVLPAGDYVVSPMSHYELKIQSTNGRSWAIVVGSQSYQDASGGSQLEFDRLGESYFLRRVLSPSLSALNIDVPSGRSEKAARERQAHLRSNSTVLVAMR